MSSDSSVPVAEAELPKHPVRSPGRAWDLFELAKAHLYQFQINHSGEDLDLARELFSEAIECEPDTSKKARYLGNLGIVYQYRYNQTGHASDLGAFLDCTQQAKDHIADEFRPAALQNYANALQLRFSQDGDPQDLDECIGAYRDTLSLPTASRPKTCSNLCAALMTRSQLSGSQSDLDEACRVGREAVSSTDEQHPMRAIFLDSFANALCTQYTRTNSIPDLNESIRHGTAAVSLAKEQGLPEVSTFCLNLGGALASRFKIYRELADLDDAIDMFSRAEDEMNPHNPSYGKIHFNKGNALRMRFEETAAEEDLVRGVDACTQAVSFGFKEMQLQAQAEDALGNVLLRKYDFTGLPDILDEAVRMYKQALQRRMDATSAANIWNNLGAALQTRFELRGSLEDLHNALEAIEKGLKASTARIPGHASSLVTLGNVLVRKFERLNLPDTLDQAVSVYKEALDMTPETDQLHAGRLSCLGHALQIRFESQGLDTDFEEAVRCCRKSIDLSNTGPTYFICLVNLGNCFLRRVIRDSSIQGSEHLSAAIKNLQTAADEMPKYSSTRAMCLNNLGKAYELKFERTQMDDDFDKATRSYKMALDLSSATPVLRVTAGYRGMVLTWSKDPPTSVMFLKSATKLLHMVSPRILNRADQQDNIATFSGLASIGASILLESGSECFEALQILELSRGVMSSMLLDARIDTTDLENHDPDLAKEFIALRDQLDSSPNELVKASDVLFDSKLDMERRITASKRFNEILDKIRSDDKTNGVFLGPTKDELQSLSESGTIVVINVSFIRSDALIITKDRTWHYSLQDLNQADVLQHAGNYIKTLEQDTPVSRKKTSKSLHSILKWLWDAIVGPILIELGTFGKAQGWPRIWWIPVGLMSIFPLHAAGDHSGKTDNNALDRVISSYAPTIKSLSHSRRINQKSISSDPTKAVFIAMSSTPNQADLNCADTEVTQLLSNMPEEIITKVVFKSPAYKHDVLPALQGCGVAHFSCHGIVDHINPSNSRLLLSDWETSPLTVADINALKLSNARLAYLSACHASSNRAIDLLDEGIHLTGAFQMAGFPQAIGSLWQVDDERSAVVSRIVWDTMLTTVGGVAVDFGKAAEGLHHALRALREETRWVEGLKMRFPDQPIVWAPFIHMGM